MQRTKDPEKYCACGCGKKLVRKRRPCGRLETPFEFTRRLYVNRTHYFDDRYHGLFSDEPNKTSKESRGADVG